MHSAAKRACLAMQQHFRAADGCRFYCRCNLLSAAAATAPSSSYAPSPIAPQTHQNGPAAQCDRRSPRRPLGENQSVLHLRIGAGMQHPVKQYCPFAQGVPSSHNFCSGRRLRTRPSSQLGSTVVLPMQISQGPQSLKHCVEGTHCWHRLGSPASAAEQVSESSTV